MAYLPLGEPGNLIQVEGHHEALTRLSQRKDFSYLVALPEKLGTTTILYWKTKRGRLTQTRISRFGKVLFEVNYG